MCFYWRNGLVLTSFIRFIPNIAHEVVWENSSHASCDSILYSCSRWNNDSITIVRPENPKVKSKLLTDFNWNDIFLPGSVFCIELLGRLQIFLYTSMKIWIKIKKRENLLLLIEIVAECDGFWKAQFVCIILNSISWFVCSFSWYSDRKIAQQTVKNFQQFVEKYIDKYGGCLVQKLYQFKVIHLTYFVIHLDYL